LLGWSWLALATPYFKDNKKQLFGFSQIFGPIRLSSEAKPSFSRHLLFAPSLLPASDFSLSQQPVNLPSSHDGSPSEQPLLPSRQLARFAGTFVFLFNSPLTLMPK
jgi:hypothetical protein